MRAAGGLQTLGDAERAKAESPILADFHDSAVKNGYDPLLAEAMVPVGRVVHWVENDATASGGSSTTTEYKQLDRATGWKPVAGRARPGRRGRHAADRPRRPGA